MKINKLNFGTGDEPSNWEGYFVIIGLLWFLAWDIYHLFVK